MTSKHSKMTGKHWKMARDIKVSNPVGQT